MAALIDLAGERYGRLTVVERAPNRGRRVAWRCVCDCGREAVVTSLLLRNGETSSCGCYGRERRSAGVSRAKRHAVPSYLAAHKRVYRARGKAVDYRCSCGAQAATWAYDHADPRELVGTVVVRGTAFTVAYSADPEHYVAMCNPCHRRFDYGRAA